MNIDNHMDRITERVTDVLSERFDREVGGSKHELPLTRTEKRKQQRKRAKEERKAKRNGSGG